MQNQSVQEIEAGTSYQGHAGIELGKPKHGWN